jgi:hypothetical protein
MKKLLPIAALFTLCAVFAINASAQKCTSDDYSLVASFDDAMTIRSDGSGPYTTVKGKGSNSEVMFQICNKSNDFTMNLNTSSRSMKVILPGGTADSKFFNFDRVASVPVTDYGNPAFAAYCGTDGAGQIILDAPNTANDNYAGCGFDGLGYFVRRNVGFQLTNGHSLRFQNSPLDGGTIAAGTSYIKVYHPTPNSWTLAPEEKSDGTACSTMALCSALIYQPNRGAAYVQYYLPERFVLSVTSSRNYQ